MLYWDLNTNANHIPLYVHLNLHNSQIEQKVIKTLLRVAQTRLYLQLCVSNKQEFRLLILRRDKAVRKMTQFQFPEPGFPRNLYFELLHIVPILWYFV